jgi:hypothetical protein
MTTEVLEQAAETLARRRAAPEEFRALPESAPHGVTKRNLYEKNGVSEYWVVDLKAKSITQLVLRKKHYALTGRAEADTIRGSVPTGFESNVGALLGLK